MARIILVTGGTRSGKSDYAQARAEELKSPRCFVATSTVVDKEMEERIKKHREGRKTARWQTIEEPIDLLKVCKDNRQFNTLLVDCITLWISNIMEKAFNEKAECDESYIVGITESMLAEVGKREGTVLFVTNEVGMGIVPDNAIARKYRDLVGRCNRIIAFQAQEVILVSCGLPFKLKGE